MLLLAHVALWAPTHSAAPLHAWPALLGLLAPALPLRLIHALQADILRVATLLPALNVSRGRFALEWARPYLSGLLGLT